MISEADNSALIGASESDMIAIPHSITYQPSGCKCLSRGHIGIRLLLKTDGGNHRLDAAQGYCSFLIMALCVAPCFFFCFFPAPLDLPHLANGHAVKGCLVPFKNPPTTNHGRSRNTGACL